MSKKGTHTNTAIIASINEKMTQEGRSHAWLARQCGVSRQYINSMLHGLFPLTDQMLDKINEALHTNF